MMNIKIDTGQQLFQVATPVHQKGIATLVVSLFVLTIITLMVIFATKVGIFDQQMSANEYRYKEAFAAADGGLEYAIQQFSEHVSNSNGNYIYDPDKNGTEDAIPDPFLSNNNLFSGVASASEARFTARVDKTTVSGVSVYAFTSAGESIDRTGKASVSEQIVFRHITGGKSPNTPVISGGSMNVSGNMNIVPNPNASCPSSDTSDSGCAVSVWTHGAVSTSASISTCQIQGFSGGQCPNPSLDPMHSQITNGTYPGVDIVQNDAYSNASPPGHFPPDVFDFVFGVPSTQWTSIKTKADEGLDVTDNLIATGHQYADCGDLSMNSKGIIWITGNCSIGNNARIGSEATPVILVVHNGALSFSGSPIIYGIVFAFDEPGGDSFPGPDVGGSGQIRGSLISNNSFDGGPGAGEFSVVWDPNVFTNIQNNSDESYRQVASIPGSWHDF